MIEGSGIQLFNFGFFSFSQELVEVSITFPWRIQIVILIAVLIVALLIILCTRTPASKLFPPAVVDALKRLGRREQPSPVGAGFKPARTGDDVISTPEGTIESVHLEHFLDMPDEVTVLRRNAAVMRMTIRKKGERGKVRSVIVNKGDVTVNNNTAPLDEEIQLSDGDIIQQVGGCRFEVMLSKSAPARLSVPSDPHTLSVLTIFKDVRKIRWIIRGLKRPPQVGDSIPLYFAQDGIIRIGQDSGIFLDSPDPPNDVVLWHHSIAIRQASIIRKEGTEEGSYDYFIRNNEGRTAVNDRILLSTEIVKLNDGDKIRMGHLTLKVVLTGKLPRLEVR